MPGVAAVGQADIVPMSGSGWNQKVLVSAQVQEEICWFNRVSPGYFKAMGTPVLKGRDFEERDDLSAPPMAIVNETFVRKYLEGKDPLTQAFQIEEPPGRPRPQFQIVGVAKDTKYYELREDFKPIAYLSADQETEAYPGMAMVVRTSVPAATMRSAVAAAIRGVHRRSPSASTPCSRRSGRRCRPRRSWPRSAARSGSWPAPSPPSACTA
jgi:hypothetical protein